MIELAILGLLSEQELHGYELKKQLAELLGPFSSVSFGSLYPALARLEKAGRVKAVEAAVIAPVASSPMTGALSGELAALRSKLATKSPGGRLAKPTNRRGKKVYGITMAGRDRFLDLLTEPGSDDDRAFGVRVAFCRHLDPVDRLALLGRRRADIAEQLQSRRRSSASSARNADPYRHALRERESRTLQADLAWLDELIAATEADPVPAPTTGPSVELTPEPSATVASHAPSLSTLPPSRKSGTPS